MSDAVNIYQRVGSDIMIPSSQLDREPHHSRFGHLRNSPRTSLRVFATLTLCQGSSTLV